MTTLTTEAKSQIQGKLDAVVAKGIAPAIVYGATTAEGEILWAQAGPRDLTKPDGEPIGPDSVLWICSQTKMIASLAIFQVIETGKITLDTKVADVLPELANPIIVEDSTLENRSYKPATNPILIRHLLNHSSGLFYQDLPRGNNEGTWPLPKAYVSPHDPQDPIGNFWKIVKGDLPAVPLVFEPGTSFKYGFSMDALGHIIERVTGLNLEEHCKKYIFGPLGLNSTSFYLTPELKERLLTLSFKQPDGSWVPWAGQFPIQELDPKKVHVFTGGIGLYSTGRDYLTLQHHLLQVLAGTAANPIIKRDNLQLFFEPSLTPEGENAMNAMLQSPGHQHGLGLGVEINDQGPGRRKAGTGYWSGWAGTTHFIDPKAGVAVYGGVQVTLPPQFEVILGWEDIHPVLYNGLGID